MATSNFGWPKPADTDLVRDGAAAIRGLADAADATVAGLQLGLREVVTFTANGTFTKADYPWLRAVRARAVGGGGGGGGAGGTASGDAAAGGGGGSGGYAEALVEAASLPASVAVTVGSGGSGGIGEATGAAGGTTSFGSIAAATGGGGGDTNGPTGLELPRVAMGGLGGDGTAGDFTQSGSSGGYGLMGSPGPLTSNIGGNGAPSILGGGVRGGYSVAGSSGQARGAGGSGAARRHNSSSANGGGGVDGVVIVELYG